MKDSGDIAGTGIPFAAGVAAGAFLAAFMSHIPVQLPLFLGIIIPLLLTITYLKADSRHPKRGAFAALFLLTGVFCSINASITSGISLPKGPLSSLALTEGEKLKRLIDSIPYPCDSTGPLVKALLTGDRSGLGKDIRDIFRDSGASHILALSGLHLGILYLILSNVTAPMGNSPRARRIRFLMNICAAGFYALMRGASPSIVRAFLFISIGETARLLDRSHSTTGTLLAALTIQLALNPEVIGSLGFQLSYLAIAGIALLYHPLAGIYPAAKGIRGRMDPMRRIWEGAVLSISCQVFTAPLVWYRFHTFPKFFIITNLTALPLTSAVMVLSVTTTALTSFGICPEIIVLLNDKVVQLLVDCLRIISSL